MTTHLPPHFSFISIVGGVAVAIAISIAIAASGTFCTVQYHAEVLETFLLINIF